MSAAEEPRLLGVVEALTTIVRQCPSGAVQRGARAALAAIEREGAAAMPAQVTFVLTAIAGWRGEKAELVKRSLEGFLREVSPD